MHGKDYQIQSKGTNNSIGKEVATYVKNFF